MIAILLFSIIEYILLLILTKWISVYNYDYVSLRYSCFSFSTNEETATGMNNIISIFFPTIFIIILSGVLYETNLNKFVDNIYLVTLFYYLIKWLVIILVLNRGMLINWKKEFIFSSISFLLSYFIYCIFITQTTKIFVSIDEIRDGIWVGIITFALSLILKLVYNHSYLNVKEHKRKIKKYVKKYYNKFHKKYCNIIKTKNKDIKFLTYAIMIYENYNRSFFIRVIEYIKFFITGKASLGIMQVSSSYFITNEESVKLGYRIIKNTYFSLSKELDYEERLKKVVLIYNKSNKYVEEVMYIFCLLKKYFSK